MKKLISFPLAIAFLITMMFGTANALVIESFTSGPSIEADSSVGVRYRNFDSSRDQ